MFRDAPDSYKSNPFLDAVSKPGAISQFFYEGTCQKLDALFYKGWTEKVADKLNLSKGLFLSCFLADLDAAIYSAQKFKCFDNILRKLADIQDFLPTVFEVEMAEYLLHIFKNNLTEIEFAGCFTTKAGKKIDLRAKIDGEWVYFEMTKVMNYEGCSDVLRLYNLTSAFLVGAQMTTGKSLGLQLKFPAIPNQDTIDSVIDCVTRVLSKELFSFEGKAKDALVLLKESEGQPKLELQINSSLEGKKLKDKYFEELEHFENGDINVIAIDTTYLPTEPKNLLSLTEKIFDTEGDLSIIAAVILTCKVHFLKPNGFPLQTGAANIVKFNKKCDKAEFLRKAMNFKQK